MSLAEILPDVRTLSRDEKVRLIRILAEDLEREPAELIEPGRSYPIESPDRAFAAASILLEALEEDQRRP